MTTKSTHQERSGHYGESASAQGADSTSFGAGASYGSGSYSAAGNEPSGSAPKARANDTGTTGETHGGHAPGHERTSAHQDETQLRRVVQGGKEVIRVLQSQLDERPVMALLGVAGVSFLAGSLVGSRVGRLTLIAAAGYVAANLLRDDGSGRGALRATVDAFNER